jgi:hypothetical protein
LVEASHQALVAADGSGRADGSRHREAMDLLPTAQHRLSQAGAARVQQEPAQRSGINGCRQTPTIPGSDQTIGIYSPERSIADAFRLRGGVGYELARDALREWLRRGGKPARLIEITSRLPRAKSPILQALDMLG